MKEIKIVNKLNDYRISVYMVKVIDEYNEKVEEIKKKKGEETMKV